MLIETNRLRSGMMIRSDVSANLMLVLDGALDRRPGLFADLTLSNQDVGSRCFDAVSEHSTLVLSTWGDMVCRHFRRKDDDATLGFQFTLYGAMRDLTKLDEEELGRAADAQKLDPSLKAALNEVRATLAANYATFLELPLERVRRHMREIARRFHPGRLIVVLPSERRRGPAGLEIVASVSAYNAAVREALADVANAHVVGVDECVESEPEILDYWLHYHRVVYFRLYKKILALIAEPARAGARETAVA